NQPPGAISARPASPRHTFVASLVRVIVVIVAVDIIAGVDPPAEIGIDVQPSHHGSGHWLQGGSLDAVVLEPFSAGASRDHGPVAAVNLENDADVLQMNRRAE